MTLLGSYKSVHYECPRCWNYFEVKLETLETKEYPSRIPCQSCGGNMAAIGTSMTEIADGDIDWGLMTEEREGSALLRSEIPHS